MMHADEIRVSTELAARLVAAQFPAWRDRPVRSVVADGTVHALHRIGDDLVARFPLQVADTDVAAAELARVVDAVAELAALSPVPTPRPVALGEPGPGYPMPWSVQTWVPGRVFATDGADGAAGSTALARDLAGFIAALRAADTGGREFTGAGRGGHLPDHDEWMDTCLRESVGLLDVELLRTRWEGFRELPRAGADVLSHGDLIPGNVLVADGRLAGVLDGDGFGPADPALELVAAWHLLDDATRAVLRAELGCGEIEWARGQAWAFQQAMGLVWYYRDTAPALSRLGRRTLARVAAATA